MRKTTITLGEFDFIATYEYVEGESSDYDYAGTQPMVRLWHLETLKGENVTDTVTKDEWFEIEEQLYTNLEL